MNTSSSATLFDTGTLAPDDGRTFINPSLWFIDNGGFRVIFSRHEVLYRFSVHDKVQVAYVAVMLRQSKLATQAEIAAAFGHSVATQRRWETDFARESLGGLPPKAPVGRPGKLGASQQAHVELWFSQGVSNLEMARRLGVDEATIRRFLRSAGLRREVSPAPELPFTAPSEVPALAEAMPSAPAPIAPPSDPVTPVTTQSTDASSAVPAATADNSDTPSLVTTPATATLATPSPVVNASHDNVPTVPPVPSPDVFSLPPPGFFVHPLSSYGFTVDTDPANRSGDRLLASMGCLEDALPLFDNHEKLPHAGVLLAVPVLQAHGGLSIFQRVFASLGAAFYGLRTIFVCLYLMALMRIKRPEHLKEHSPTELGGLIGLDRFPEVKTVRRKLTEMADQKKGCLLQNELAKLRLAKDAERLAYFYFDGHVREYTGKAELAKAKKPQRSVATCAATDNWVHDALGQPLLLFTSEMNEGLTQVLEPIVSDVKTFLPEGQRFTAVFDRGGWSPKLFKQLKKNGADVITYRKGKTQTFPASFFSEHTVTEDGKTVSYMLYDQPKVRAGRLRNASKKRAKIGDTQFYWMRQITVLREDGRQINILTNRDDLPALEVVMSLFRRWRQENFFKYMDIEE